MPKARYTVIDGKTVLFLEQAPEGGYAVTSPTDPGLNTQAETIEDAFRMAADAAAGLKAARKKLKKRRTLSLPVSPPRPDYRGMAEFLSPLEHTVTVQSQITGQDATGGNTRTYATRQAGVACLITQQGGSLKPAFNQPHRIQTHTVSTLYQGVQPGDRLLVTAGPANAVGKYLRVLGITNHGGVGGIAAFARLSCLQEL